MWIDVLLEDLNNGKECPITLALRRVFNKTNITVSRNYIKITPARKNVKQRLLLLPQNVVNYTLTHSQFSFGSKLPFNFWLPKSIIKAIKAN